MARRWRLRNKLLLGLGLVVGSVGLLLTGTIQGLTSYVSTMNTADSKLAELLLLDDLKPAVSAVITPSELVSKNPTVLPEAMPRADEPRLTREKLGRAREIFEEYKKRFQDTVARKRDPDPYLDSHLIQDIDKSFDKIEEAIDQFSKVFDGGNTTSAALSSNGDLKREHDRLLRLIDELRIEIANDMYRKITEARKHYRQTLWTVSGATALALLLLFTLVYLFSGWVFTPLKQLQAGVNRVAEGNFEHPIDLKSGDELEELANAFNGMTSRLHDIYRDLERQVDERSRQLVRSERMVSVGFLAAGVAHEINNPLASIAFCGEALQSRLSDYLRRNPQETEVITKYLGMIQQEAFRCKEITSKLLEFSRVGERRREPTDLAELVQGVLEIAQHLPNCRGRRIIFQPYATVVAGVNAQDLKSVVLNLVVNSLDSMDEGGVLTITLMQKGPQAEMVFTDTGCGMSPDVLANIFEPFFTKSRSGKGTGLGLFISHQIVDQHGGRIEARSAGPNQGSTFTVIVPLQPVQGASNDSAEPDVLPFGPSVKRKSGSQQTEDGIGHAAA
ncbi:MAG: HAMP domain-containing histidine kinase [Planctomycetes bacterium]|nr:HAMP domain-containing histidine kinase [Planctomycetota bacterium]